MEFAMYLNYTRDLLFEEEPDYAYLKEILRGMNYKYDNAFDWISSKNPLVQEMIHHK